LVLFGLYLILLLTNAITNSKTIDSLEDTKYDRDYVKGVTSIIDAIKLTIKDEQALKLLDRLYDVIHGSQIKTSPKAMIIETEIEHKILELERQVSVMNVEEQIYELEVLIDLANKRNIIAKRSN